MVYISAAVCRSSSIAATRYQKVAACPIRHSVKELQDAVSCSLVKVFFDAPVDVIENGG